jgi:hypothetical protein
MNNTMNVQGETGSFHIIETNGLFEAIFYGLFGSVPNQDHLGKFVNTYVEHILDYGSKPSYIKCKKLLPLIRKYYDEFGKDLNRLSAGTYEDIFENKNCSTQIAAIEKMQPYINLRQHFNMFIANLKKSVSDSEYEYIICNPASDVWKTEIKIVEKSQANDDYVIRTTYVPTEKTKTIFILHKDNKYFSLEDTEKADIKTKNAFREIQRYKEGITSTTSNRAVLESTGTKTKNEEDEEAFFIKEAKKLEDIIEGNPKVLTTSRIVNIHENPRDKETIDQDPTTETIAPFTIKYTVDNKEDLKALPSTQTAFMRAFNSGKASTATSIGSENSPSEQSVRTKVNTTIRNNPEFQNYQIDNIVLVNSKNIPAEDLPTKEWYFKVNLKTKNNMGGWRVNKKNTKKLKKRRETQKRRKSKKKPKSLRRR